jgi:tetratricopeptide (TPR) repeat protein
VGLLLLAGAGVGAYLMWWPRKSVAPPISLEGLDAEVVAVVESARAEVEAQPQSGAAWGHLGMVLFAQDLYAGCIPILAEAEGLDPDDARWPYFRGLALILERPEEGIAALERAVQVAPSASFLRLRLAEQYLKLDRIDEADALFRNLLVELPDHPRALLGRGQVLARRGQWRECLAPLEAAAKDPAAERSARVALAEAYGRLGEHAAAERQRAAAPPAEQPWPDPFLAEAQRLRTGLAARIQQTVELSGNGRIEEALALISQVLRDHPSSDAAHLTLAKVLIRAGQMEPAGQELVQALRLNPNLPDGHFLLAGIQMLQKDYHAAERSYLRALELKPTLALAHYNLGKCRLKQGNKAGAIDAFQRAVRYRPDLVAAHVELGELLLQDRKVKEAITSLDNALRLDSKNARARTLLQKARAQRKS